MSQEEPSIIPTGPTTRLFVVVDANFYRGISANDLDALCQNEAGRGIVPLAGFWPSLELLAHLADSDSAVYPRALAATRKLQSHCGYVTGREHRLRLMEDSELQLCRGLFNVELATRVAEIEVLSSLIVKIGSFPARYSAEDIQAIRELKERVAAREETFAAAMRTAAESLQEMIASGGVPDLPAARTEFLKALGDPDRRRLTAQGIAVQVAARANVDPSMALRPQITEAVLTGFPISVEFFIGLMRSAVESEMNWEKSANRNSMWDWHLSFHAAPHVEVNNRPLLLVSSDSRLIRAAADARKASWVVSVSDYRAMVNDNLLDDHLQRMAAQRDETQ